MPEAAKVLALTEEAVRQRVKRGTLDSIKVDGKLFVLLDNDRSDTQEQPVNNRSADTSNDRSRLVNALEDEVAHLRRQLDQANERYRENRRTIA
jgi:vacuolar-type H+-ATPase catalytic subunit A/Vma1